MITLKASPVSSLFISEEQKQISLWRNEHVPRMSDWSSWRHTDTMPGAFLINFFFKGMFFGHATANFERWILTRLTTHRQKRTLSFWIFLFVFSSSLFLSIPVDGDYRFLRLRSPLNCLLWCSKYVSICFCQLELTHTHTRVHTHTRTQH